MIRGQKRALDKRPSVNVNLNASIHNRFDIEVIDAKTGEVKQRAQAFNVICDYLWSCALAYATKTANYFQYIQYGSGSGTPSAADTALFNRVGSLTAGNLTINTDMTNHVVRVQKSASINESTAVGVEITEVGISQNSSSGLCTHAMLQDMNGNQISIVKTDTDIINIYATIFFHWDEKYDSFDNGNNVVLMNVGTLATHLCGADTDTYYPKVPARAQLQTAPVTSLNSGLYTEKGSEVSVDVSKKTTTYKYVRFGAGDNNLDYGAHFVSLTNPAVSTSPGTQLAVYKPDPSIITGEAVGTGDGTTVDFATKFDCPYDAVIKVDGVATEVSVTPAPLRYQNMEYYFQAVELRNGKPCLMPRGNPELITGGPESEGSYRWGNFYNPFHAYGVTSFFFSKSSGGDPCRVLISDDLETWVDLTPSSSKSTVYVPEAYQYYKYLRTKTWNEGDYVSNVVAKDLTGKNIHFPTAPTSGAVITADYKTPTIAKDSNHVFDLTVSMRFGEYTE